MALICQIYHPVFQVHGHHINQADSHLHTLDLSVLCPITPPPAAALNILKDFTLLSAASLILSLVIWPL